VIATHSRHGTARGRALATALVADALAGDAHHPLHPVVLAGRGLEGSYAPWRKRASAVQFAGGALAMTAVAGAAGGFGWALERACGRMPFGNVAVGAALKATFALRQLLADCNSVADSLDAGDIALARQRVAMLVSRPTVDLPPELVASATIESAAENLVDSVVAPLGYFLALGLPAAAAYRVVNTADAMFGYRDEREWLGKAAAKTDDTLNLLPSRVSCMALVLATTLLHGRGPGVAALRVAVQDSDKLASPNAGWMVAAMAGALERRLEKRDTYVVGAGFPPPDGSDVRRATALVGVTAALLAGAALATAGRRPIPRGARRC
jgi:adenosylcobinamide-phosphate synthase